MADAVFQAVHRKNYTCHASRNCKYGCVTCNGSDFKGYHRQCLFWKCVCPAAGCLPVADVVDAGNFHCKYAGIYDVNGAFFVRHKKTDLRKDHSVTLDEYYKVSHGRFDDSADQ